MLLPCDHIFCNFCVPRSTQAQCECPVCKLQYVDQEIRAASHMESMIAAYRNLNATFSANVFQSRTPESGRSLEQSPVSVSADDKSRNEQSFKAIVMSDNDPNMDSIRQNGRNNAEEIDLNQLQQQSPGSSLSSDSIKDIAKGSSQLGEGNTDIKCFSAKRSADDSLDVVKGLAHHTNKHEDVFSERDVKRQKKLNYGSTEASFNSQLIAVSEELGLKGSVCAFCHSSKITEGTGPVLCYANGKEVFGASSLSNAIPVHTKCIDWAPQVYYDGEIIKNLEAELARAAKLKCSGCGLKGAALGCLVRSCRRSYHLPCALEIHDCRWDCDNFVMLCPSHKTVKFPSEKFKRGKCAVNETCPVSVPLISEKLGFGVTTANVPKEWVLCGSALSSEERYLLAEFANMCGATVCKTWKPNITHVIAATDEKGACTRTLKVLMAILSGKWILTIDWIKACIEANCPKNEEDYEICLDNHGCYGAPKAGRLRALTNAPKLFDGFKFFLSGDYVTTYKNDLLDLVENAGGTIIHSKEQLMDQSCLVVYNCDPPHGCAPGEESNVLLQRQAEAEDLAKKIGCRVIQHTWILESIAACKLAPFCS